MRAEFEQAMKELRSEYENEQKSKAKLEQDLTMLKQQYDSANKDLETIQKSSVRADQEGVSLNSMAKSWSQEWLNDDVFLNLIHLFAM